MKRLTLTALILLFIVPCLNAQRKEIAQARSYIKSGNNLDKAEQLMINQLKDSDNSNRQTLKLYVTWMEAVQKQYDIENEKLYLKQKYDTVALFNATRKLFLIAERLDSADVKYDSKGRVKTKYRDGNVEMLKPYRLNLYYGGNYFLHKKDFATAFNFYDTYINCAYQPLFTKMKYVSDDAKMNEVAYWATYAGYKSSNAQNTLKYINLALKDTAHTAYAMQYQAEADKSVGDSVNYLKTLKLGFKRYTMFPFFFARLIDYFNRTRQYETALAYSDSALAINDTLTLFLFAKSTALLNLGRYKESLAVSDTIISRNGKLPDAYYNAASAYLNHALELENGAKPREKRFVIRDCYIKARPYMEKYRELSPDADDKWAPALYRIYLNLNMGKQFDEIDRLINKKRKG